MTSRRANEDAPNVTSVYSKAQRYNAKPCKRCGSPASTLAEIVRLDRKPWEAARDVQTGQLLEYDNGRLVAACPGCGKPRYLSLVQGVRRADIPCNAKCLASYGPRCECSCGGRNHGGAHGVG